MSTWTEQYGLTVGFEAGFRSVVARLSVVVGFLAVAVGAVVAHLSATTGYELSIYSGTPFIVWGCAALAILVALPVSASGRVAPAVRVTALVLGMAGFALIVGLPVIRDYHFFGVTDALSHLGWARDFRQGTLSPLDMLYPASHLLGVLLTEFTGLSLTRAVMLVPVVFAITYILFVPLCVGQLTDRDWAIPIGFYAALLLVPINNVSVFLQMHPTSQAILFLPAILFVLLRYLELPTSRSGLWGILQWPSAWDAILTVLGITLVFVHPQQAVNLIAILGSIVLVRIAYGLFGQDSAVAERIMSHRIPYIQTVLVGVTVGLWAPQHNRATGGASAIISGITDWIAGTGSSPVDGAQSRSASLTEIGGSVPELFVKLFLPSTVFLGLAGLLSVHVVIGRLAKDRPAERAVLTYLAWAFGGLTIIFLLYLLSSASTQHYRQIGTVAMLGTILGAVYLTRMIHRVSDRFSGRAVWTTIAPVLVVLLLLSAGSTYRSPFIYQTSDQLTEAELVGYETAFEVRDEGVAFTAIRGGTDRATQAVYGREASYDRDIAGRDARLPPPVFDQGNVTTYYDNPRYLVVTERDYQREVTVLQGLRFSERGFESIDRQPGVGRVVSTGDFQLYYVVPDTEES
jgi:hypothetical protein